MPVELAAVDGASSPDPGPGHVVVGADWEDASVDRLGECAQCFRAVLAFGDGADVMSVEVVVQVGEVDRLPGEAPFYAPEQASLGGVQ